MRLTDLFASLSSVWPVDDIDTSFPSSTDGSGLSAQMADAIEVEDATTDIAPDGSVTVAGKLTLVNGLAPAPTTLVSRLFPSMRFAFAPAGDWNSDFRVSSQPGRHMHAAGGHAATRGIDPAGPSWRAP